MTTIDGCLGLVDGAGAGGDLHLLSLRSGFLEYWQYLELFSPINTVKKGDASVSTGWCILGWYNSFSRFLQVLGLHIGGS